MKKLITTDIQGTVGAPLTAPALDTGLQDNMSEIPAAIIEAIVNGYTSNDLAVLYGVQVVISTGTNPNDTATWTKGAIYYNGEVYQVSAGSKVKPVGSVFLFKINISTQSEVFDDGISHDWITTRTITIDSGTTGTGIADVGAGTVKRVKDIMIAYLGLSEIALAAPTFQTGWISSTVTGQDGLKYSKKGKLVHLRGGVQRTTGGTNVIAQLPAGFIPTSLLWRSIVCVDSSSNLVLKYLNIDTSGNLRIDSAGNISNGDTLCLDWMYFID